MKDTVKIKLEGLGKIIILDNNHNNLATVCEMKY